MNDDEHLRAIRESLDDDAPRLVYADVLSERGDPRGELIVVQCARAALEREGALGPELRALVAREREILNAHVKEWVNPFGLRHWWGDFERGFIAKLSITIGALRSRWSMFQTLPLREIRLRSSRHGVPLLGELAWLGEADTSLCRVTLDGSVGYATFDFAALRPILRGIRDLDPESAWGRELPHRVLWPALREIGIDYPAREHLHALTGSNVALDTFRFNVGTPFLAEDMHRFVSSPSARSLRHLWAGFLEDEAAIEIFRAPSLPSLRELSVTRDGRTRFPPDVGEAFTEATFLEGLTSFRSDLMVDDAVARAIGERMPALDALHVDREPAPGTVERLLGRALTSRLRRFSLTGASAGGRASATLVTRAHWPLLRELVLSRFHVTADDARALPPVLSFHAYDCDYGPGAPEAIKDRWPFARTT